MSENGWPPFAKRTAIDRNLCDSVLIPGTELRLLFQRGIPAIILAAFMADLNEFIEPVYNGRGYSDEGSWTGTNSVDTSNHYGATAFDYNWTDHPVKIRNAGWNGSVLIKGDQVPAVRELLRFYNFDGIQMVYWGNDWNSFIDSMHFQMGYGTYENQMACWRFINARIRADGFSTWRRGGVPRGGGVPMPSTPGLDQVALLRDGMGRVPDVDYAFLLPYVRTALRQSDCTNNNRIAMWFAQIGHESVGLRYMKEIGNDAYFSKYNNRNDLGNGPNDGPRYPGRGPIQVTGRSNYKKLSEWAYAKGYVGSPTYFEDNPVELEKPNFAFLGAIWYWTVARSDINSLCDKGDIQSVTRRINGGTNGLTDRTNRWNLCRGMNLMPLLDDSITLTDWEIMMASDEKSPSRSIYRSSNDKTMTNRDAVFGADALGHHNWVESCAREGEVWALDLIRETASEKGAGAFLWYDPTKKDQFAINKAKEFLATLERNRPAVLQQYIASKGI